MHHALRYPRLSLALIVLPLLLVSCFDKSRIVPTDGYPCNHPIQKKAPEKLRRLFGILPVARLLKLTSLLLSLMYDVLYMMYDAAIRSQQYIIYS